jgi:CheY-like chemotaxis protein
MLDPDPDDFDDDDPTMPDPAAIRTRVLVAEDDGDLRQIIAGRMRREGFDVLEACSGDAALEILITTLASTDLRDSVDLLVMDVRMPGTSGLEVTRLLRSAQWSTPVLLITAYPDARLLDEAAQLRAAVLAKPFALDQLSESAIEVLLTPDPTRRRSSS